MRIESHTDQLAADARMEAALGWDVIDTAFRAALIRAGLASLRPHALLAIWFRERRPDVPASCVVDFIQALALKSACRANAEERRLSLRALLHDDELNAMVAAAFPSWLERIRPLITRRADLFAWVYGPSPATAELVHVRLPSRERRLLVDYLRAGLRKRYPWLTTKLVCAMAFKPQVFAELATASDGQEAWGPLYRRVVIQRGRKNRFLWIPNPVLKRLQKSMLRLLQPTIDRAFGDNVLGARPGIEGPTFVNAGRHLHRSMIASFDIKDFFPSTTTADVIRGLQHLSTRTPLAVDASRPSDYEKTLSRPESIRSIRWTDDLRVFVARLGMHRGRLPQGSPLSPLLANVAFSRFDERIVDRLDQEFGVGKTRYTRYFDDLTVSFAAHSSSSGISQAAFRGKCERIIGSVLEGARYRLNSRKTRCGMTASGFRVTGLVVREDRVSVPRSQSRSVRAVAHAIKHANFVDVAKRWAATAGRPVFTFASVERGHRAGAGRLRRHRLSAERLASFMLRSIYPDLKLQCILRHWYPWRERFDSLEGEVAGKQLWPLLEWVLSTLWTGCAIAERELDDSGDVIPNRILIRQDGQSVCRLSAESNLGFFFLSRDDAIAVVECWQHLRGVLGYLSACPDRKEFKAVLALRDRLRQGLASITLDAAESVSSQPITDVPAGRVPLTHEGEFVENMRRWDESLREYVRELGIDPGPRFGQLRSRVTSDFADSSAGFGSWVCQLQELLATCPRLPAAPERSGGPPAELLYDYIRIRSDIAAGHVEPVYECLQRFESEFVMGRGQASPGYDRIQTRISEALLHHFERVLRGRITNSAWMADLHENLWAGDVSQLLQNQVERFEIVHAGARTSAEERRLFRVESWNDLAAKRDVLAELVDTPSSDRVWERLQEFGIAVYIVTCEAIEEDLCPTAPPEGHTQPRTWKRGAVRKATFGTLSKADKKCLNLLESLRHRAAHGESPECRSEWVDIQKVTAELLGRSWRPREGSRRIHTYRDPDDLVLTAHEGTVLKVTLLRAVNNWLNHLVETHWWRPGAGG
jgi:hypothetical protein